MHLFAYIQNLIVDFFVLDYNSLQEFTLSGTDIAPISRSWASAILLLPIIED